MVGTAPNATYCAARSASVRLGQKRWAARPEAVGGAARSGGRRGAAVTLQTVWLSHHYPDDYDRCVLIGRRHVCRRCLVMYPVALATVVLAGSGVRWPHSLDPFLLVVLCLPALAQFVLEHLGVITYRPVVEDLVMVPASIALGVGFDRYLHRHTDPLFWACIFGYGTICFTAVLIGARRARRAGAVGAGPGDLSD